MKYKYKKFLKAAYINYDEDYCGCGSSTFIKPTITTPIIVITGNTAIIACAVNGATIYYTLDGSTPTSSSTEYTGAITLTLSCTIKAIAVRPGMTDSEVASESYVHYLTEWRLVGNSEVHTDPFLTSWKVSGNSVVQDGVIMSCGDLGQDGKYHVKISNGVNVFDIPLDAPLRKVNDVADTIEFPSITEGKALVTRYLYSIDLGNCVWNKNGTRTSNVYRLVTNMRAHPAVTIENAEISNALCGKYTTSSANATYKANTDDVFSISGNYLYIYDEQYNGENDYQTFATVMQGVELIYLLATPTTELVDVSPFPVSSTDTYTSANVVPYSAFEYKKNVEIWSCGEYSATDGKWHILVQPLGGSIADIALTEPLRKVNDVADTIEFPSGTEEKALVTRNIASIVLGNSDIKKFKSTSDPTKTRWRVVENISKAVAATEIGNILSSKYPSKTANATYICQEGISLYTNGGYLHIYDENYSDIDTDVDTYKAAVADVEVIFELATPTTELVDAPQIAEAESYSMVISQGGKAVEWSSFETE